MVWGLCRRGLNIIWIVQRPIINNEEHHCPQATQNCHEDYFEIALLLNAAIAWDVVKIQVNIIARTTRWIVAWLDKVFVKRLHWYACVCVVGASILESFKQSFHKHDSNAILIFISVWVFQTTKWSEFFYSRKVK